MTAVYVVAGGISFKANKRWTFRSDAYPGNELVRYAVAQFIGWGTNFVLLSGLHYGLGLPHWFAQIVGVAFVAIELFLLSRYYVFK